MFHFFACGKPVSQHRLLKRLFFLHCLLVSLSKISWLWMCGFVSGLCSAPLVYMYVFMPVLHCFGCGVMPSTLFFCLRLLWLKKNVCFGSCSLLWFWMDLRIIFSVSVGNLKTPLEFWYRFQWMCRLLS